MHVDIPNYLQQQFAVTEPQPGLVWRCDLHLDGTEIGISGRFSGPVYT